MRRLAALAVIALTSCAAPASPSSAAPEPTAPSATSSPYVYPDLPGRVEDAIAEAACEDLEVLEEFMDRDAVDRDVREAAFEAIDHRADELGCDG